MPLTLPAADERTYGSLVADMRSRLPRLAPEWTDYNAHDPGITMLELFAYLTETDLYRLARVTAAQRRAFLRWFGIEGGGPTVAETVVAFAAAAGGGAGAVSVAADREIASAGGDVLFSTTAAVTVQSAGVVALFAGERQLWCGPAIGAAAGPDAIMEDASFTFGARGADPLVIALDAAPSGEVSLYVWTGAPDHDEGARARLQDESAAVLRDRQTARYPCPASRLDDWRRHYEVDVVWEAYTLDKWVPVPVVEDRTRALTMSGFVRLQPDRAWMTGGVPGMPAAFAVQARR